MVLHTRMNTTLNLVLKNTGTVCDDVCASIFKVMTRKDGLVAAHSFVTQLDTIWESVRWSRSPCRASFAAAAKSNSAVHIQSVTSSCGDATKCVDGLSSTRWEADINAKDNPSIVFRLKEICCLSSMAVQFGGVYASKWTVECAVVSTGSSTNDDENKIKWHYVAFNTTGVSDWSWIDIPLRNVGVNALRLTILKWSGSLKMKSKDGTKQRERGSIRDVALYVDCGY